MTITAPNINIAADVRAAKRALSRLNQSFPDGQFAQAIGLMAERMIDENFRQEANDQGPWEALKAATLERRRGGSGKILQDTGRLRMSFESARVRNNEVRIGPGNNVVYAATHQYGDPSRNIPARPMLPTNEFAERQAARLLDAFVKKKTREAGLT